MRHLLLTHGWVGLIVAALVLWAAARAHRGRAAVTDYALAPLPAEIIAALDDVPPLQKPRAARAYRGRRFRWRVTYDAAFASGLTTLRVMCLDRDTLTWVVCDVNRWRFPQLNGLLKNTPIWIMGRIGRIHGDEIDLRDAVLDFGP